MATPVIAEVFEETDGVTRVRFRVREATDDSREAIDMLMNIVMGKYPKRARFTDSTTVVLEARTDIGTDSSK